MPKRLVKRAWGEGLQRPTLLARSFQVSPRAMGIRLQQLGLVDEPERCAAPSSGSPSRGRRRRYFRQLSPEFLLRALPQGVVG